MDDSRIARMKELVSILNRAGRAYYVENQEIMSNLEYDRLYDELLSLEKETGTVLSSSPTQHVGYEAVDRLPKERHEKPMLSLDKTKDREALRTFIGSRKTLVSWKLDGLTVVLTYENGSLAKAVTRGNGIIGEVITPNARVFENIPLKIPYKGELILRGEAVISYPDFKKINESFGADSQYKNPRNLCSGSVRQLDSRITAKRHVRLYAFALVKADGVDFHNSRLEQFHFLQQQGFEVVEHVVTYADTLDQTMDYFEKKIRHFEIPSDGLVALYDDIAYGESLGETAKYPRNAYAFKWKDEEAVTRLRRVEWSASRTGLINPVAVFDPVQLEGTTVTRASVHNVSILKELRLGIGDEIKVYKANMIIPQIAENLTKSDTVQIPEKCPVCGGRTAIHQAMDAQTLFCENPDCPAKKIKSFTQFVSRDAMNIDGLSEMTLEKLIGQGLVHTFGDLFRLRQHRDVIVNMEGFGEKSCDKLDESIEKARTTTLPRLRFALGVPGVGVANAKGISRAFGDDLRQLRNADLKQMIAVNGVGDVMAQSIVRWFSDPGNKSMLDDLLREIRLEKPDTADGEGEGILSGNRIFEGKTFVITGSVSHYPSRRQLKEEIERLGGKVAGSVSSKTSFLINNDALSGSSKNRAARELGIPVITEQQYLNMKQHPEKIPETPDR